MTHMLGVESEVGQLRQAIVHRPGLELTRLTPRNCDELLFDDVLWADKAREEHDAFAQVLRDQGVTSTTSWICSPRRCDRTRGAGLRPGPRLHRVSGSGRR